jgi:SAM-dependent methyltransferase
MAMYKSEDILALYSENYADQYEDFYLHPWAGKHNLNVFNLRRILKEFPQESVRWLDLGCGQAWHFSQFPSGITKVGFDLSIFQLKLAKKRNPDASFIQADMSAMCLTEACFDLITCFWAAYCYLNSDEKIAQLVRQSVSCTRMGGAIYFEVLLRDDLPTFNQSTYSGRTGFKVNPRTPDFGEWSFRDAGGRHNMTSPPLALFLDILAPRFQHLEAKHDGGFMTHVIAFGRNS